MPEPESVPTWSVVVRLRKTTIEAVHMSVLVTNDLMKPEPEPDGSFRIDVPRLVAAAIEQGKQPGTAWTLEQDALVEVHPLQTPS